MKSSFGKLRKFALQHHKTEKEKPDHHHHQSAALYNELAQASLDMQDMRACYDSLLAAAAATANSAFEFSESLRDMGACLQEKTVLNDHEESSNLLSMLGNVQFELQKLVDSYRSHINLTITTPSESLLNELRTVEEMKRQCDEKRSMYEYMVAQQREKGRSKSGKMEVFSSQQLQAVCDAYNEEATLCVFRLKSLKQGQCRSLITQAARHHAAQLNFFRKGLKSLEAVEPHMRLIAEKQHIDYELPELDEGEDDGMNSFDSNGDGELSFDYRTIKQGHGAPLMSTNPMEVDPSGVPRYPVSTNAEVMNMERRRSSYSAPISAEKKFDPSERVWDMQQSIARKSYSYVLPTPNDAKASLSARTNNISASKARPIKHSGNSQNLAPSSQIESETREVAFTGGNLSLASNSKVQLKKELSSNDLHVQLPQTLAQGASRPHFDQANNAYDTEKVERQAFSGPIISKSPANRPALSTSGPITPFELPQVVSGLVSRVPAYQASFSSPKVSPTASPPIVSSPRISELHELPRPPEGLLSKAATAAAASSSIGQSAPLNFRKQELSPKNRRSGGAFSVASPLPTPPLSVSRSFSIPSSNQRSTTPKVAKLLEPPQHQGSEEVVSPPLTPISLSKINLLPNVSEMAPSSGHTKGI